LPSNNDAHEFITRAFYAHLSRLANASVAWATFSPSEIMWLTVERIQAALTTDEIDGSSCVP